MLFLIIGNLPGHLECSIVLVTTRKLIDSVANCVTCGSFENEVLNCDPSTAIDELTLEDAIVRAKSHPGLGRRGRYGQTKQVDGDLHLRCPAELLAHGHQARFTMLENGSRVPREKAHGECDLALRSTI
jgi:hypothetical protein